MKKLMFVLLVIGIFSCKKETHVTKELKKAVVLYVKTIAGDTIKVNQCEVIRIDSVSSHQELLRKIAIFNRAKDTCIALIKRKEGNMNTVNYLYDLTKFLEEHNAKLTVELDTFAYYDVKTFISMTYRDSTIADTTVLQFNKNFTVK